MTPRKPSALMLVVKALDLLVSRAAVAAVTAPGGCINACKFVETMSKNISQMNDGQALIAYLVPALLVIFASRFAMAVSTTPVSIDALLELASLTVRPTGMCSAPSLCRGF